MVFYYYVYFLLPTIAITKCIIITIVIIIIFGHLDIGFSHATINELSARTTDDVCDPCFDAPRRGFVAAVFSFVF